MPTNPWDAALKLPVTRGNALHTPAPLEPGVKYFVLALEQLGCETVWSCEGHPNGFYITFCGPMLVAHTLSALGVFNVEIFSAGYRLGLERLELEAHRRGAKWTDRARKHALRQAAAAWEAELGKRVSAVRGIYKDPAVALATALDQMTSATFAALIQLQESQLWPGAQMPIAREDLSEVEPPVLSGAQSDALAS